MHTTKPEKVTQETDDGCTTYEAAQTVDGRTKEIKVGSNGQVLETEDAIAASDLPAAAMDAVKKKAPKAEIKEVRRVTVCFYEVELAKGSQPHELKIYGNGQPVEDDD